MLRDGADLSPENQKSVSLYSPLPRREPLAPPETLEAAFHGPLSPENCVPVGAAAHSFIRSLLL